MMRIIIILFRTPSVTTDAASTITVILAMMRIMIILCRVPPVTIDAANTSYINDDEDNSYTV